MMRRLRIVCVALALASVSMTATGCAARASAPVAVRLIYDANEATIMLGTLQHVAIELNKTSQCSADLQCHVLLSDRNTRIVVSVVTPTLRVIDALPNGWPIVMRTALEQIEQQLDGDGRSKLSSYLNVARAVLPR